MPPEPLPLSRPYPLALLPDTREEDRSRWLLENFIPHEAALRAWLRVRFSSLSDCDDAIQESYARLLRMPAPLNIANPKAYLFMVARNVVLDLARHQKHAPRLTDVHEDCGHVLDESRGVVDSVSASQELELLADAIAQLPERCAEVMRLRQIQGCASSEIASRLGISVNTVNAQVVIGLARCRLYLKARGVLRGSSR